MAVGDSGGLPMMRLPAGHGLVEVAARPIDGRGRLPVPGGAQGTGQPAERGLTSPAPVAEDIGDIAVLHDTGDLVAPANQFDIARTGLRFTRNGVIGGTSQEVESEKKARSMVRARA